VRRVVVLWMVGLLLVTAVPASLAGGSQITNVTIEQARKLIQERGGKADFVVLDVRTPGEFAAGHLPSAVNIDLQAQDFERRLAVLDRGKSYLVYCRSGNRSTQAIRAMDRLGFRSLYHMSEGTVGWEKK
jgi:rhodanese-related sulfurtransferase